MHGETHRFDGWLIRETRLTLPFENPHGRPSLRKAARDQRFMDSGGTRVPTPLVLPVRGAHLLETHHPCISRPTRGATDRALESNSRGWLVPNEWSFHV